MNTAIIFTALLSYLLLMLTITHTYAVSSKTVDGELAHSSGVSPHEYMSIYQGGSMIDNSDEHEFEKRRFNAWAGKRNLMAKRRFNAWAGRR